MKNFRRQAFPQESPQESFRHPFPWNFALPFRRKLPYGNPPEDIYYLYYIIYYYKKQNPAQNPAVIPAVIPAQNSAVIPLDFHPFCDTITVSRMR